MPQEAPDLCLHEEAEAPEVEPSLDTPLPFFPVVRAEVLARLLGIQLRTLQDWVKDGVLSSIRVTQRTIFFDLDQVREELSELSHRADRL